MPCTLWCGHTLEGRGGIQRDLDWLERLVSLNLMKFRKGKCKVLRLGQVNSKHKSRLGENRLKAALGEGCGVLFDEKFSDSAVCAGSPGTNCGSRGGGNSALFR